MRPVTDTDASPAAGTGTDGDPGPVPGPVPELALDGLLRRAAAVAPDRVALRTPLGDTTYADLDAEVDTAAGALTAAVGGTGAVVGVVAALDVPFVVAYYGAVRAGHTVAVVNPLMGDDAMVHALGTAEVAAVVAPPQVAERLERLRPRLPKLGGVITAERLPTGLLPPGERGPAPDPDAVACIQFTSGTTGDPKAVRLTHRNLVTNAAQIAAVHGLDGDSVTVNHLPLFHPMHLNSAVHAAATQVLCPDSAPTAAVAAANRNRATHLYSLPVRLAALAADPGLGELRLDTVRAVLSGGSALLPAHARVLAEQFGVPVVQGYGLAETSPLTHCERPGDPRPGSVGRPVPGTDCRVVDVQTRAPLPAGERGEVQVRGPQLMAGYLNADGPATDADGWFSTGDIGYQAEDGHLFLVDRLKDVFKHENWLVSPTEIEEVLIRHPAVLDCAVVDHPEPATGAVAHAFVVLAPDDGSGPSLDELAAFVNGRLPYYQHIRYLDAVDRIPRSPNGKILRRNLRRATGAARPDRPTGDRT
ncbi:class I adenylate-forming enzyme family protein [Kitasatospora sp. A2-31]|uniref:class I adenylate-forming enzyme family protein n=1 Tax=Kitasatospora sp. A2-31 TaxID=2916414 RepID=UPI001EEBACF9|nr:AMP-binding protein [Kitasatospora sp. A2-31]